MKKILITYSTITSVIMITLMMITTIFSSQIGYDNSEILGYTFLILSFLVIYFAIVSFYKNNPGAKVRFMKSLTIGLLITLFTSVAYVIAWLIIYYTVFPDFWIKYSDHVVAKLRATGASAAEISKKMAMFKEYDEMSKNPFINAAMTFIEPLPVGILISLISSVVVQVRRKKV